MTIVEFLDRMLPLEDEEVSAELAKQYKKLGVNVLLKTRVDKVEDTGKGVKVTVTGGDGKAQVLEANKLMQAIGFLPRTKGYGLENTGVKLTERGAIDINEKMQTNVPHIFAIGDATAKLMLAHVAEAMGVIAAEHIAQHPTIELDYVMMPRATYCHPQVASFGYTEKQARDLGYDINVGQVPIHGQRQGARPGRNDGLRQAHQRQEVRRNAGRAPDRPGRDRAAA